MGKREEDKKVQINATISKDNEEFIKNKSIKEKRNFSNMLDVLIDRYRLSEQTVKNGN